MADFPALPLFTDAYLSDTHPGLSLEEHGAYLLLLMLAWRRPECVIPDDDEWIARRLSVHGNRWRKLRPVVLEQFWTRCEGGWTQKRLRKERGFVEEKREKNRGAANARWAEKTAKPLNGNDSGGASALHPQSQRYAPTPTPIEDKNSPPSVPPSSLPEKALVSRKRSTPAHGSRLPDDWRPSQDDLRFAASVGLSPQEASREAACFSDYWHGRAGEKGRKADWPATWRNWTRRAVEQRRQRDGPNRSVLDAQRLTLEAINGSGRYDDDDDREQPGALRTLPWPPAAGRA